MKMLRLQMSGGGDNGALVYDFVQSVQLKVCDITPKHVIYRPELRA
jgi:hypothetical protein